MKQWFKEYWVAIVSVIVILGGSIAGACVGNSTTAQVWCKKPLSQATIGDVVAILWFIGAYSYIFRDRRTS